MPALKSELSTDISMTGVQESQPAAVGATADDSTTFLENLLKTVRRPVWIEEPISKEDSDSTESDDDDDNNNEEAANPDWFDNCCVSDHVRNFKAEKKSSSGGCVSNAVILRESLLWEPGQEITYAFLGGTRNQQDTVRKGMKIWMRYANIQFKMIPIQEIAKSDIRIAFKPKNGNWSRLGLTARDFVKTKATANFCGINLEVAATEEQMGVVLHEIGHILGLKHEHQSPSLKGLLTWIESEVKAYFDRKCRWKPDQIEAEVLTLEESKDLTSYTHLDVKSIMMYPMPKSTNMLGLGKKGVALPENTSLSMYDKAFIGIHYPFFNGNPHNREWSFEDSLKAVGCGEYEIKHAMELFNAGDWKSIRRRFEDIYHKVRVRKNLEVESQLSG